jgi:broad specificity phosphatase PhoE
MEVLPAIDATFFADLQRETMFHIVRHAESEGNVTMRMQGHDNQPLTARGRRQAALAGRWFRPGSVGRVFCSPLDRAYESARIICDEAGFPQPELDPLLIELDTGRFSGLTFEEARARYPLEYARFQAISWEAVPEAETVASLLSRSRRAWLRLKTAAIESASDVLAVTHGGTIQWLVRITFGATSWMPLITAGNCGIFRLLVIPNGPGQPAYLQWKEFNLMPGDAE